MALSWTNQLENGGNNHHLDNPKQEHSIWGFPLALLDPFHWSRSTFGGKKEKELQFIQANDSEKEKSSSKSFKGFSGFEAMAKGEDELKDFYTLEWFFKYSYHDQIMPAHARSCTTV